MTAMDPPDAGEKTADEKAKKSDLLNFGLTGRLLSLEMLENEFTAMSKELKKPLDPVVVARICQKSGTHLLKLVSPRTDGDQAVIRISPADKNARPQLLPSVNAADIPYAKVIFRPLEIEGHQAKSLVDHILTPDDLSGRIYSAFSAVFGADVLEVIAAELLGAAPTISTVSSGEFPVIFVPSPKGGDLQITPVSPAAAFMDMKQVTNPYFQKQKKGAPAVPRGRWQRQAVSAQPQNISGAIGGPRVRFFADMPDAMTQWDAELYAYVRGGSFPRWRSADATELFWLYADRLDAHDTFNNQDTRRGLDMLADRLIKDAEDFIAEACEEAYRMADDLAIGSDTLKPPPRVAEVIRRMPWKKGTFDRARRVLASEHFKARQKK